MKMVKAATMLHKAMEYEISKHKLFARIEKLEISADKSRIFNNYERTKKTSKINLIRR